MGSHARLRAGLKAPSAHSSSATSLPTLEHLHAYTGRTRRGSSLLSIFHTGILQGDTLVAIPNEEKGHH